MVAAVDRFAAARCRVGREFVEVKSVKDIEPIAGYRKAEAVRQRLGLSAPQFREHLRLSGVSVFRHPSDLRIRLLRDEDAQFLLSPRPDRPRKNARIAA